MEKTNWLKKIEEERARQITLGYTPEHDDTHKSEQIANHAAALATNWLTCVDTMYPYSDTAIKDGIKEDSRETQLVKAGALIIAELERLERVNANLKSHSAVDAKTRDGMKKGNSNILEDAFNKTSSKGMIVIMKVDNLPANIFSGDEMVAGKVIGVSVIEDRSEDIERRLTELNLIDEFDKSASDNILELASDILSHDGDLEIK